jgi:hypothetical protein
MKSYSCLCTVSAGKLKLFERADFDRALATFPDGVEFELSLEEVGRKRTRAQEKFWHGPCLAPFIDAGYAKQEAKDMLMLMYDPQEVHQLDGSIVLVPGRTSKYTVGEYNALIEWTIRLAAEQGWVIEDADVWREQQEKKDARGSYKLTAAEMKAIRQQVAAGESQRSVAASFGLSHSTVKRVLAEQTA